MKKVLLFGATGMAGHVVYYYLRGTSKYDLSNVVYRTPLTEDSMIVDVSNREVVVDVVQRVRPDIIINCIGVLVKGSKEHPENAILLNAYFPHLLKTQADAVGAKLIHISTDCVFSGKKGHYTEDDFFHGPKIDSDAYTRYDYSDVRTVNAGYVKLSSVYLTYEFDSKLLKRWHMDRLALTLSAYNLYTFCDKSLKGQTPTQGGFTEVQLSDTPSFTFGISANF